MFKLYTNKSSLDVKTSRYSIGGSVDQFTNRLGYWTMKEFQKNNIDDIKIILTKTMEKRPDIIAMIYYNRVDLDWLILQYNSIVDINEELLSGMTITIPSYQRVLLTILPNQTPSNVQK